MKMNTTNEHNKSNPGAPFKGLQARNAKPTKIRSSRSRPKSDPREADQNQILKKPTKIRSSRKRFARERHGEKRKRKQIRRAQRMQKTAKDHVDG
eukprot:922660-Prorocentrum_minimum.AAC.1